MFAVALAALASCWLLGTPVVGCDGLAQRYREAATEVPTEHWALVHSVGLRHGASSKAYPDGRIVLSRRYRDGSLWHEVGHLVGWAEDSRLLRAFTERFWPDGRPRGRPSSRYAARHGPNEDFAETYRLAVRGGSRTARTDWMTTFALSRQ